MTKTLSRSSSVAVLPRWRLKLGKPFQNDGEHFSSSIPGTPGLDRLDCLSQYFFSLGLWQNPLLHEGRESELGKLESGKRRCRSVSFICLVHSITSSAVNRSFGGDGQARCLGGLQIDHEIVLGRLLVGQITRLLSEPLWNLEHRRQWTIQQSPSSEDHGFTGRRALKFVEAVWLLATGRVLPFVVAAGFRHRVRLKASRNIGFVEARPQ